MEKGKLIVVMPETKELPWLVKGSIPVNAIVLRDPAQAVIDAKATEAVTDTGELKRSWLKGVYTINTAKTQAVLGWIGGEKIRLADTDFEVQTRNASVAVQSLDDVPILQSKQILISLGARAVPKDGNKTPFHVEPVEGKLSIKAPKGLKLYKQVESQEDAGSTIDLRQRTLCNYTRQFAENKLAVSQVVSQTCHFSGWVGHR